MGNKTGIEWTDATWNPIRGCSRVSEGCRNCYAERTAGRFSGGGQPYEGLAQFVGKEARWTGEIKFMEDRLEDPLRWKRPRRIFVNSMSDLFHEKVTVDQLCAICDVMGRAKQHTFQVLTKRPERMFGFLSDLLAFGPEPPAHIWWGVSVEDQKTADERIPLLLQTPAAVRWVSYEPALGPVDFGKWIPTRCCNGVDCGCMGLPIIPPPYIDWLVAGGESGQHARLMHPDWARSARDQCVAAGVPLFFKQWGEHLPPMTDGALIDGHQELNASHDFVRVGKKAAGRTLDGRTWDEYPR